MLEHGYDVYPIADGEIHRFKGPEDKKPNGWYVFHGGHGAFGNWKTNLTVPWSDRTKSDISPNEYRKLIERERAERIRTDSLRHAEAAAAARSIWAKAQPATGHPYLKRKQVQPHGIRVNGDRLVVPMTIDTHIHSLQFISDDHKKFMPRGRVKGCYYPIGSLTNQIWIAEGFATAATVYDVTGHATVCAFNARNLIAVTEHFVKMGLRVFIAADNDEAGIDAADKSIDAGAEYASWPEPEKTDWNDYGVTHDAETTYEALCGI